MSHLLVTNDFPPKVGGIQSYLWELWRRLPPERVTVLAPRHPGAREFDAAQAFRVERAPAPVLLPTPALLRRVRALADEVGAAVVVLDPVLPLGLLGPRLGRPYALVVHGAEVRVPARLPGARRMQAGVLRGACHVVAGGRWVAEEVARALDGEPPPTTVVPPGVDTGRFRPLSEDERAKARADFGLPPEAQVVVGVSRLVPRKGMDVVIEAAARLAPTRPGLAVAIAGSGRDAPRLRRLARRTGAPVRFLGPVAHHALPALYACADVLAVPCRSRWAGLEQEGFGIVFVEAAACGVPQVAGDSGGAAEAVAHGESGLVVGRPHSAEAVAAALAELVDDPGRTVAMGRAARARAVRSFSYEVLAPRLDAVLAGLEVGGG